MVSITIAVLVTAAAALALLLSPYPRAPFEGESGRLLYIRFILEEIEKNFGDEVEAARRSGVVSDRLAAAFGRGRELYVARFAKEDPAAELLEQKWREFLAGGA